MHTQIIIKRSPEEVATSVAEWLIDTIRSVLQVRPVCSVALSGGSTPKRLYEHLAAQELHCLDWSRVMLFWGDERNVPDDHPESNGRMVREAWLDRAVATREPRCIPQWFPVPIQQATPERAARQYSQVLREALALQEVAGGNVAGRDASNEMPRLDVVLLGLGDDSHTASLFPETAALDAAGELFVANFVPKLGVYRLTMTFPLINAARHIAFLVCGSSKQDAIDVVWHGPRQASLYPAQAVQPVDGELFWFLDTAALPEHRRSEHSQ